MRRRTRSCRWRASARRRAKALLPRSSQHPTWQVRMYAARAAGVLSADRRCSTTLAADRERQRARSGAVGADRSEAARSGRPPRSTSLIATGLSTGHHRRARARQTRARAPKATPPLLTALGRITKEHKDTSRDPRMAILNRLQAYGDASQAVDLEGYLKDFDPAVAQQGRGDPDRVDRDSRAPPAPQPLPPPGVTVGDGERAARQVAALSHGGPRLLRHRPRRRCRAADGDPHRAARRRGLLRRPDLPPHCAELRHPGRQSRRQRIHRRARSTCATRSASTCAAPSASRRAAATPATRRSSSISIDSPRLDHIYTVFGTVVAGMDVVDGILEGDVIERVELVTSLIRSIVA